MATRREFVRSSIRGVLCAAAASAGLSACAAISGTDDCHELTSTLSARQRSVGGRTVVCDPDLANSAEGIPHADDYVLQNKMW